MTCWSCGDGNRYKLLSETVGLLLLVQTIEQYTKWFLEIIGNKTKMEKK